MLIFLSAITQINLFLGGNIKMELLATILTVIIFYIACKHGRQMTDGEAEQSDKAYDDNPALWPSNIDDY